MGTWDDARGDDTKPAPDKPACYEADATGCRCPMLLRVRPSDPRSDTKAFQSRPVAMTS